MDDDKLWQLRGIWSQMIAAEQDVVFILTDRKFNASRKRDLVARLSHLIEQINDTKED